jgi:alkylation response protein AidB-like acyl-CoA dehydrogenase
MYSPAAGTAYITFDKVRIEPEQLLGEEGKGLFIVLSNFNKERWGIIAGAAATCRLVTQECILWASQREVFGKNLLSQPVIRLKLAAMIGKTEAAQHWTENITYQMTHMDYKAQAKNLAGQLAFLKMMTTKWMNEVIDDAVQIFGGRALTKTGTGRFIERAHASKKFEAVGGGSEEIMGDLGMRQL